MRYIFGLISGLFLVYLLWPGPSSINDFSALPNSSRSTLEGDTIQVPNVAGYFSDNYRNFSTNFYYQMYWKRTNLPFAPLKLNHPPELAFIAIKDQTQSTYLEEYYYPLRDSIFVNGLEPFEENGQPKFQGATDFEQGGKLYKTKVTLRYYPSPLSTRVLVWLGINLSVLILWRLSKKVIFNA